MTNERLSSVFRPSQGRRLCVVSGVALEDLFYLGDVPGAQRASDALSALAVDAGFDLVLSIGVHGRLGFARPDMQPVFVQLTAAVTPGRPGDAAREEFRPRPREAGTTEVSAPVAQVEQQASDPLRNQLARVQRAIDSPKRVFAIVEYPEDLWIGTPSTAAVNVLKTLGEFAVPKSGHPESTVVLLVKPDRRDELLAYLDQVAATEQFRRCIDLAAPGRREVESFLARFMLRENLTGSSAHVVSEAVSRRWLLLHLHEALRRVLSMPPDQRRIERALDTGDRMEMPDAVMAELDRLVGLAPIKEQVRRFAAVARQQQEDIRAGRSMQPLNTHMLFLGNPGTGKTEVARLVGRYLRAIGLRTAGAFVEISRTDLASEFNPGECIRNMREAIDRAAGGVLFVDEAYQLAGDEWMRGALETLMKDMEDRRASMTVIFAGYEDRMQDLWSVNAGFRSRIPEQNWYRFPDYTAAELADIWRRMCDGRHLELEPDATPAATRYMEGEVRRGRFGNARGVRNLVDQVVQACAVHGERVVTTAHIPPAARHDAVQAASLLASLRDELIGAGNLHQHLELVARRSRQAEEQGRLFEGALHCRFVGPPGTGKTSAAMRMGELLHAMGLVSRGHVHTVNPVGDLISQYAGDYAQRVAHHFQQARGGVLFIDEAYQLAEQEQGRLVVHQIVQTLTSPGFADTAVVLAGYRDAMNSLVASNPGLQSRIPNEIVFDALTDDELVELFHRTLGKQNLVVHEADRPEVGRRLKYRLSNLRADPNFASARTLQSIVQDVLDRQYQRLEASGTLQRLRVMPEDVAEASGAAEQLDSLLTAFAERFVGMESLKARLRQLAVSSAVRKSRGGEALPAPRMLFLGNPGTGKTMAAREAARILSAIGCTSSDRVAEVRGVELKGSYLGQTKDKVLKAFQDARGGVLIIDEAYALQPPGLGAGDSYAAEAIDTLVGQLQLPENLRTAVILAGYTEPMKRFLRSNPGLDRRFPDTVEFADYSTAECVDILCRWLDREDEGQAVQLDRAALTIIEAAVAAAKERRDFGNAGEMENLGRCIVDARNLRVYERPGGGAEQLLVSAEDVETGLKAWVARRQL